MPYHAYECDTCKKRLEFHQPAGEAPYKTRYCDDCGGSAHHVIVPAHVIFKGSGFSKRNAEGKTIGTSIKED